MTQYPILDGYENIRLEAKRALGGLPHSVWETYSAFANTDGGVILLGVSEKDKKLYVTGLCHPEEMKAEFWALVNNPDVVNKNILQAGDVTVRHVEGLAIIAITVPRAKREDLPIYVGTDSDAGTYIRVGEGDLRLLPDEIRYYFALRGVKSNQPE